MKADIGLIGLAVMGENLVLNMESKGFTVAVFNRTVEKVDKFISGRGTGKNFIGTHSIEEFSASLERPRKVMMLVKAGQAVDDFIEKLIPHLEAVILSLFLPFENPTASKNPSKAKRLVTSDVKLSPSVISPPKLYSLSNTCSRI